jgi:hypothetical protein
VAAWHVSLAQAAGIDAFLVDWWGRHAGRDGYIERGIRPAVEKAGFKYALLDERAQYHADWAAYKASVREALRRHLKSPAYLRIDGRPVYYLYQVAANPTLTPAKFAELRQETEAVTGPLYWIVDKIAHQHGAATIAEQKQIPIDWLAAPGVDAFAFYSTFSHFRAHRYEELAGRYRHLVSQAHQAGKQMLLPIHPGHDNSGFREDHYIMPRRDGDTLRDYLRAAHDAKADILMITSWNEWPETTVIEPSSTWADPYQYLRIIAEWQGRHFNPPPLPSRE